MVIVNKNMYLPFCVTGFCSSTGLAATGGFLASGGLGFLRGGGGLKLNTSMLRNMIEVRKNNP